MLVEAFNRFKTTTSSSWKLVLAGSDWNGAQAVHEACRRSPYRQAIRLLGFVPDDQLPDLYRAAGAFVYPSLYEGFGMPPCEAMACGCPVISSTGGALGEVVGKGGVLLPPQDQDGWVSAMTRMATDPEWAETWLRLGVKRAAEFDWRQTAAATLNVYAQAAAKVGNRYAGRSKPKRSGTHRAPEVEQIIYCG
jgi:glycosyltransferase involved in cell wall biosynthesis